MADYKSKFKGEEIDAGVGNAHLHANKKYLDDYHPDKVCVFTDGITMQGDGSRAKPLVSPRQGAILKGPYRAVEDIPSDHDHNAVYIVDTGEPDSNGNHVFAPYMFDENDAIHRIGTLQPHMEDYETVINAEFHYNDMRNYADNVMRDGVDLAITTAKTEDVTVLRDAKAYADAEDDVFFKSATDYADQARTGAIIESDQHTDTKVEAINSTIVTKEAELKDDSQKKADAALRLAKEYADTKIGGIGACNFDVRKTVVSEKFADMGGNSGQMFYRYETPTSAYYSMEIQGIYYTAYDKTVAYVILAQFDSGISGIPETQTIWTTERHFYGGNKEGDGMTMIFSTPVWMEAGTQLIFMHTSTGQVCELTASNMWDFRIHQYTPL